MYNPIRRELLLVVHAVFAIGFASSELEAGTTQPPWQVVASTEMVPPGEAADLRFGEFLLGDLNANGQVVFGATVRRNSSNRGSGIWIYDGQLRQAAREGVAAPGTPTRFSILDITGGEGALNDSSGNIMFKGVLRIEGSVTQENNRGVWYGTVGDTLEPFVRSGDQALGVPPGARFDGAFDEVTMNDNTDTLLSAFLRLGQGGVVETNDAGIWLQQVGDLVLIAREGSPAPGLPGRTFSAGGQSTPFASLTLNNAGDIGFVGRIDDGRRGIWFGAPTNLQPIALDNSIAPDINGVARFDRHPQSTSLPDLAYSPNGLVAYWYRLQIGTGGVTSTTANAIWAGRPGALAIIARQGDQAPGLPTGVNYGASSPSADPFRGLAINDSEQLAFAAFINGPQVTDTTNTALFFGEPGALELIAREGSPAPGLAAGIVFGNLIQAVPQVNAAGQLIFNADLRGPGIVSSPDNSLWLYDRFNGLQLLGYTGQTAEFGAIGSRRLDYILAFESGRASHAGRTGLTDNGLLLVRAGFADGTDALLTLDIGTPVPEPSSAALIIASACFVLLSAINKRSFGGRIVAG